MTTVVGGLRVRLIRESLYQMVHDALEELGWFDSDRKHSPVTFQPDPIPDVESVPLNTAALADMMMDEQDWEMGSRMTEFRWTVYVDFFGEADPVATHFIHDVRDILGGRISDVGRTDSKFDVYDYRQATPPVLFSCDIENILIDRPTVFDRQFQRHWFTCRFEVVDYYGTDEV